MPTQRMRDVHAAYNVHKKLNTDLITSKIIHVQNTLGIQLFQTKKHALR